MTKRRKRILFLGLGALAGCLVLCAMAFFFARWIWRSEPIQARLPEWRGLLQSAVSGTPAPGPSPALPNPTIPGRPPLVISSRETREESLSPSYTIAADWPYVEWGDDPRIDPFNQAVEALIEEEIRTFKEGVANLPEDPQLSEFSSSLQIGYDPTNAQNGVLSVLMHISYYSAGAAHPGSYSHAINFDLREGKQIALADLFLPDSAYLEVISSGCLDELRARNTLAWEEGALPIAENFRVWNITPDGLLITFDPYQVAPYAAGPQEVILSYDQLKEFIRPEGPLSGFVSH